MSVHVHIKLCQYMYILNYVSTLTCKTMSVHVHINLCQYIYIYKRHLFVCRLSVVCLSFIVWFPLFIRPCAAVRERRLCMHAHMHNHDVRYMYDLCRSVRQRECMYIYNVMYVWDMLWLRSTCSECVPQMYVRCAVTHVH